MTIESELHELRARIAILQARLGSGGAGGLGYVQGGNSFGATGVLGTADNNELDLVQNGSALVKLTTAQAVTVASPGGFAVNTSGAAVNISAFANGFLKVLNTGAVNISGQAASSIVTTAGNLTLTAATTLVASGASATVRGDSGVGIASGVAPTAAAGQVIVDGSGQMSIGPTSATAVLIGNGTGAIAIGTTVGAAGTTKIGAASTLSLTTSASLLVSATAGNFSVDSAGVIIGTNATLSNISITGTAALTAASATAGSSGAVPAQVSEYLVISFRGNTRKIPLFAN